MRLTEHFTLEEFTHSETAEHLHVDNSPQDVAVLHELTETAELLEQVRAIVNCAIKISSGYRSPELNRLIGGVPNSQHVKGQAADIDAVGMNAAELFEAIGANIVFDQCIREFDAWVHISQSDTPRRQRLVAHYVDDKKAYLEV